METPQDLGMQDDETNDDALDFLLLEIMTNALRSANIRCKMADNLAADAAEKMQSSQDWGAVRDDALVQFQEATDDAAFAASDVCHASPRDCKVEVLPIL